MQFRFLFPHILATLAIVSYFGIGKANAEKAITTAPAPSPQSDLFELSVGYNYIHLDQAFPETEHLHGVDLSFFYNLTPTIGLGGEFMAGFGSHSVSIPFGGLDVDSRRYVYVFGPRVTLWRNQQFRVFAEALAGGVHAEAELHLSRSLFTLRASDEAFAAAVGGGLDWRFSNHWAWRIIQADYLPTTLGNDWQSNFRASTAIVYSFGRK